MISEGSDPSASAMNAPNGSTGGSPAAPAAASPAATPPATSQHLPLLYLPSQPRGPHPIFGHHWAQLVAGVNVHNHVKVQLDIQGTQHSLWRRMLLLLISQWDVAAHVSPDFDNHDDDIEWRLINISVKSWLYGTMSLELMDMLMDPDATASSLWTAVESLFVHNKRARQVYLTAKLHEQRQGSHSASVYCARLKRISDALRDIGKPVSDDDLVVALLRGLSDRHKMTGKIIRRTVPPPDFDTAISMLLMDELEDSGSCTVPNTALAAIQAPPAPVAPATGNGLRPPSPNTGKPKRKRYNNYGASNNNSGNVTGTGQSAPWTGYVHAFPVPLPVP